MTEPDPAARRFFLIVAVRFGGAILAAFGAIVVARRLIEPAEIVGGALMLVGAGDAIVMPLILARRWRSKLEDGPSIDPSPRT